MGCVYILKNPAMPGLIKIGYTTRTAEVRANELYEGALGVPKPFVVVHINDCEDPPKLEAIVHKRLDEHRINPNREFFKYSADEAYQLVKDLHKENQQERKLPLIWEKIKNSPFIISIMGSIIGTPLWNSFLQPMWTRIVDLFHKLFGHQ